MMRPHHRLSRPIVHGSATVLCRFGMGCPNLKATEDSPKPGGPEQVHGAHGCLIARSSPNTGLQIFVAYATKICTIIARFKATNSANNGIQDIPDKDVQVLLVIHNRHAN